MILTPERLAKITKELSKGRVANYPGILKASHEALRALALSFGAPRYMADGRMEPIATLEEDDDEDTDEG